MDNRDVQSFDRSVKNNRIGLRNFDHVNNSVLSVIIGILSIACVIPTIAKGIQCVISIWKNGNSDIISDDRGGRDHNRPHYRR